MRRAYLQYRAEMHVVADPTSPGEPQRWCAVVGGCMLADPTFFTSAGARGCCVRYIPQIKMERRVAMTDEFARTTPGKIIRHFQSLTESRWTTISVSSFFDMSARLKDTSKLLLFVTSKDITVMPGLDTLNRVWTARPWLDSRAQVSEELSATGVCSR